MRQDDGLGGGIIEELDEGNSLQVDGEDKSIAALYIVAERQPCDVIAILHNHSGTGGGGGGGGGLDSGTC